jgi:hypothetical protein
MSRDWSQYNEELVKRGEILIAPPLLFIKFALRIPYRQTGVKINLNNFILEV